jgi:hypothetical protein
MEVEPAIHLLDCTKVEVNLKNEGYEGCGVVKEEGGYMFWPIYGKEYPTDG